MGKVAVVFWSGTGNTEMMAGKVAQGAVEAGAEVRSFTVSEFGADIFKLAEDRHNMVLSCARTALKF